MSFRSSIRVPMTVVALGAALASGAVAQGNGRGKPQKTRGPEAGVTVELAVSAAREVLGTQGFELVRVEVEDDRQVIYYRRGNQGRGRGHGPPARLVIRRTEERVLVEEAPDALRIEIGIKLGIRL